MHRAINGHIVIHGTKSWGHGGSSLGDSGQQATGRGAEAAHLVVYCVLCVVCCVLCVVCSVNFVGISSAECRVDTSKLGNLSPQQKLGNNGPP
jgi:hypothetical protein